MVLMVLFWILLILCFIASLCPDSMSPYLGRGRWGIVLILLAILGLKVFDSPLAK
jgi:hypothetical protein